MSRTVDIQFKNGIRDTVRLLGVDTPETSRGHTDPKEFGVRKTKENRKKLSRWGDRAKRWLQNRLGRNEKVRLILDPKSDLRGSYHRLLGYIQDDGTLLNHQLLQEGYARVYRDGIFERKQRFLQEEHTAIKNRKGVWGALAVKGSKDRKNRRGGGNRGNRSGVAIDSISLTDETVKITNHSRNNVNLRGWTLKSVTGNQTFTFPNLSLGPGDSVTVTSGRNAKNNPPRYIKWSGRYIWNNDGDPGKLYDANGRLVDSYSNK